jgi:hypothetical protein
MNLKRYLTHFDVTLDPNLRVLQRNLNGRGFIVKMRGKLYEFLKLYHPKGIPLYKVSTGDKCHELRLLVESKASSYAGRYLKYS